MARTVEPDTAPPADTYFPLILGPTILESTSTRFYSLRCKILLCVLIFDAPFFSINCVHRGSIYSICYHLEKIQCSVDTIAN